jgi:hypothetical protein
MIIGSISDLCVTPGGNLSGIQTKYNQFNSKTVKKVEPIKLEAIQQDKL